MVKPIGQGLQFKVYDLEDGKIKKIPNTKLESALILLKWEPYYLFRPFKLKKEIEMSVTRRNESIEGLRKRGIQYSMLGSPLFSK